MKTAFVWTPAMTQDVVVIPHDATEWHKSLPRAMRKALRVTSSRTNTKANNRTSDATDQVVTDWLAIHDPMNDSEYLAQNTCDPDFCMDEFNDIDDEYAGLTIVAPGKDTRRWLKGYNIL